MLPIEGIGQNVDKFLPTVLYNLLWIELDLIFLGLLLETFHLKKCAVTYIIMLESGQRPIFMSPSISGIHFNFLNTIFLI